MAISHARLLVAAVTLAAIFIGMAEAKKLQCPKWYKDCNPRKPGCETCVATDVNNCGDCGYKCKTLPYAWTKCEGGHCRYMCKSGRGDCDKNIWSNGCETNTNTDSKNCGCCGKACKQVPFAETKCLNGKCCEPACTVGRGNCDKNIWSNGCETDTGKDAKNCGTCGNVCKQVANAEASCVNGKCSEPVCKAGWGNCDGNWENGCETSTGVDKTNCGACGSICKQVAFSETFCENGKCGEPVCKAGWGNCDKNWESGCETPTSEDNTNCGACGNICKQVANAETSCVNGKCGVPVCKAGWGNCDGDLENGCETPTGQDNTNCGTCGNICKQVANAETSCVNGKCGEPVCKAGWGNCDGDWENGCETPTIEDAANCGACANVCNQEVNSLTRCEAGLCWRRNCFAPKFNCDLDVTNFCETNVMTNVNNCGICGTKCPSTIEGAEVTCIAGVCGEKCPDGFSFNDETGQCEPVSREK